MKIDQVQWTFPSTDKSSLEKEEHLSLSRLKSIIPKYSNSDFTNRPTANFIDLMNWVKSNFSKELKDSTNLNKFVQNRIVIDGHFMEFCKSEKATISCLYNDSIVSWNTDNDNEKFFAQGVFIIKTKELEFLHAALFNKGNSYDDEISFFVIVSDSNYEKFIEFRNKFDKWLISRARSEQSIRVIGGEDISYSRDQKWEDVFLEKDMKNQIKSLIENFLSSKDFYVDNKIPWKRGILLFGPPGNGKSSIIRTIISSYDFKPITVVSEANNDQIRESFKYAEKSSPSLLYFEDLDSLLESRIDTSTFLNLMDGISTQNGIFIIATANDISKLKTNIINRPSRFDRKFEIPLPTSSMADIYLSRWFGDIITEKKRKELAVYAENNKFSYAYLKELYISSMFEAISNNRKKPTIKDIDKALSCIMKDKNILKNSVDISKYTK